MKNLLFVLFGVLSYAIGVITLLYLICFMGNFLAPVTIDGPPSRPLGEALVINALLIGIFALQHSLMARKEFKRRWALFLPKELERSFFVLAASCALWAIFLFWEPLGPVVWQVRSEGLAVLLYALYFLGWTIMWTATFLINHGDLFGLRQVYLKLLGRPYSALDFAKPFLYKRVRHPLYLGLIIAFWAAPVMTLSRLFFASVLTIYILLAIRMEERDLISDFGDLYMDYRRKVPMIIPVSRRARRLFHLIIAGRI
jgi:methanethiol S-methyltransferase